MRTAFLILAHYQPEHLARLVRAISADWNDIYIHVDRKADLEVFVSCIDQTYKPVFLTAGQRIDVRWGGFSVVQAILSLLSSAIETDLSYDRFCLLSGADFPIKSLDEIKSEFSRNIEFMRIDRCLSSENDTTHSRYINYHYFTDSTSLGDRALSGTIGRAPYHGMQMYHGSAWWSLTRACIEYIIDFLESNPDYSEFHRTTFCPDEIYFHSIVKSSLFAENLIHDYGDLSDQQSCTVSNEHGCHYINWNAKNEKLPKILNTGDLFRLVNSEMLFARKIDAIQSSPLVSLIERMVQNGSSRQQEIADAKTLIVFQTHTLTQQILDEFFRIRSVSDRQTTVKLFYDNTASDFDFSVMQREKDYFLFNIKDVFAYFNMECITGNFYGNANLPLLYFACLHPEFRYYWLVEYDVRFSGDWKSFLDRFKSTDADLLGTTLCSREYYPRWYFWGSIERPETETVPPKFIRGFFPVVRYSQLACEILAMAYHDGWRGHYEGVVPTVLYSRGCRIEDIGGDGEFTPAERRLLFYSNYPGAWDLSPGTFVFRPDVSSLPISPDTLYHPVKLPTAWNSNLSSFNKMTEKTQLTEMYSRYRQKYIFVIGHMRSYSSLLCHILGSNPEISGYAESHLSHASWQKILRLHKFVRQTTGEYDIPAYVLDKILHNNHEICGDMFWDTNIRFIFLLRRPYESITSALRLFNNFSPNQPDPELIAKMVNYYQTRLEWIMDLAGRANNNALFIPSEDIVTKTNGTLKLLTGWLELSQPLNSNYRLFSHTGRRINGDSSRNILSGRVIADEKKDCNYQIDRSILKECECLYQQCYSILRHLNERSAMNH